MKKIVSLLCFSLIILASFTGSAKNKLISKSFKGFTKMILENKYGDIHIKNTKDEEIKLEVEIIANSTNAEKDKEMVEGIDYEFIETDKILTINTKFADHFSIKKLGASVFNKGELKINCKLFIPENVEVQVKQKEGNIFIEERNSPVDLEIVNGKLVGSNLNAPSKIKATNVDVNFEKISSCDFIFFNSKVKIKNSGKLKGRSRDGELDFDVVDALTIKTTRDKIRIKEVESLFTDANFTKCDVAYLGDKLDAQLSFGDVNVHNVSQMFNSVKVKSKRGHVGLSFDKKAFLKYDIKYKSVKLDRSARFRFVGKPTGEKKTYTASGQIGKQGFATVNIDVANCKLRLD
ncbi:MAG: hypothetical protein N4A49_09765 [Marinifilaceae bacterium]|jgi:hypothetical protein|nr:hypothetical protein [Marinifilaceae bacterium]